MYAERTRDATHNDKLSILTDRVGQPYFHREGDDVDLVTCISHGSGIEVTDLSPEVCAKLGVTNPVEGAVVNDPEEINLAIWTGGKNRPIPLRKLTKPGQNPQVRRREGVNLQYLQAFITACKKYFEEPSDHITTSSRYQFHDESPPGDTVVKTTTEYPVRTTFDRLPAITRSNGAIEYPGPQNRIDPDEIQAEYKLEDT